eukprot:scaffold44695_cov65-Phaeocystis_antarctica.AAC.1
MSAPGQGQAADYPSALAPSTSPRSRRRLRLDPRRPSLRAAVLVSAHGRQQLVALAAQVDCLRELPLPLRLLVGSGR